MRLETKAVKFTEKWPQEFQIIANRKWFNMVVLENNVTMSVSYTYESLSEKQKKDFSVFLVNRRHVQIIKWLMDVAEKLAKDELTETWMNNQDFYKDLKFICQLKCTAIWNFPAKGKYLPPGKLPIAFHLCPI